MAKPPGKAVDLVVAEARAELDFITKDIERSNESFKRITAAELARAKFKMAYFVEGVVIKGSSD